MTSPSRQALGAVRSQLPEPSGLNDTQIGDLPDSLGPKSQRRKRWFMRFLIAISDKFIAPTIRTEADPLQADHHRSLALQVLSFLFGLPVLAIYFLFDGQPNDFELVGLVLFILTPILSLAILRFSANLQRAAMSKLAFGLMAQHFLSLGSGGLLSIFAILPLLIQSSISSYGNARLILFGAMGSILNYVLLFFLQTSGSLPGSLPMPLPILAMSCLCYVLVSIGLYIISSDAVRSRNLVLQQLELARREYTAIAEALRAISRPDVNVEHVFAMLANAGRVLCDAPFAAIYLLDGHIMVPGALCLSEGDPQAIENAYGLSEVDEHSTGGRAICRGETINIGDVLAEGGEIDIQRHATTGLRSILAVPLRDLKGSIGVMILGRTLMQRFSSHEVRLIESFSIQAVMAIETVRRLEHSPSNRT